MGIEKNVHITKEDSVESANQDNEGPKLLKNFSWWSLLGIAFSLTNSWLGVSSSLVIGLSSGGPVLIIYGLIIAVFFALMCGYSLSEFACVLPNSSGTSFWVLKLLEDDKGENIDDELEERSYHDEQESVLCANNSAIIRRATSKLQVKTALVVGLINYFGSIFTSASICSSLSYSILGCYSLFHPNYESKNWHAFIIFEVLNILMGIMNSWGKILPFLSQMGLFLSLITYCVTFIVSLVCRSFQKEEWPSSYSIFKEFNNTTGWSSKGLSFIVGLANPLWAFAGIDSATHMVDEVGYVAATSLVPKAIFGTIIIGFITSFSYAIGMFYCITDSNSVINSILPIIQIYYQATNNKSLAVFLQSMCILTGTFCGIASSTWQSRILWSIGRDYSIIIPQCSNSENKVIMYLFRLLATVHDSVRVPLWSIWISHFFVAIIGCVLIGSTTAFNAIVSAGICLLLLSYAIPTAIVLMKGKKTFYQNILNQTGLLSLKGVFYYILSYIPNILTVLWAIFCFVFLSFPYELPVSSTNMNYVSAAYGGVALVIFSIIVLLW